MSYRTPYEKRLDRFAIITHECIVEMRLEKWVVIKETIVSPLLGALAFNGISTTWAVAGIVIINTLTLGELYRAFRQVQAKNREDLAHDRETD